MTWSVIGAHRKILHSFYSVTRPRVRTQWVYCYTCVFEIPKIPNIFLAQICKTRPGINVEILHRRVSNAVTSGQGWILGESSEEGELWILPTVTIFWKQKYCSIYFVIKIFK